MVSKINKQPQYLDQQIVREFKAAGKCAMLCKHFGFHAHKVIRDRDQAGTDYDLSLCKVLPTSEGSINVHDTVDLIKAGETDPLVQAT